MDGPWQLCRTIGPLLSQRFPSARGDFRLWTKHSYNSLTLPSPIFMTETYIYSGSCYHVQHLKTKCFIFNLSPLKTYFEHLLFKYFVIKGCFSLLKVMTKSQRFFNQQILISWILVIMSISWLCNVGGPIVRHNCHGLSISTHPSLVYSSI